MTTWEERAAERALQRDPGETWCNMTRTKFRAGAAWQREALLSDETVERAARALNAAGWTCGDGAHEPGEYDDCPYCRVACLGIARTALTAAIGDQS